jgi:hypothetical protein
MESQVRILNRKKMKRFLQSLRIRTNEELQERKRLIDNLEMAQDRFVNLRSDVTATIFPRSAYKRRHEMLSGPSTHRTFAVSAEDEPMEPKFLPASRFPLPMKPPPFLPSKESRNAKRILNLSRLRETTAIHTEVDPALITPSVPLPDIAIACYEL